MIASVGILKENNSSFVRWICRMRDMWHAKLGQSANAQYYGAYYRRVAQMLVKRFARSIDVACRRAQRALDSAATHTL